MFHISYGLLISEKAFKLIRELLDISLGLGLVVLHGPDGEAAPRDRGHGVGVMGHQLAYPYLRKM